MVPDRYIRACILGNISIVQASIAAYNVTAAEFPPSESDMTSI